MQIDPVPGPAILQAPPQAMGGQVFDVKAFGAKGDGTTVASVAISAGSAALIAAAETFTAADVGKRINVAGAGAAGDILATTIATYVSPTQVILGASAGTSVTNATAIYGTDDSSAIQNT